MYRCQVQQDVMDSTEVEDELRAYNVPKTHEWMQLAPLS